jgi:cytochrome b561
MSNKQLVAWGHLITTVLIWGFYVMRLGQAVASGTLAEAGFADTLGVPLAMAVGLSILASMVIEVGINLVRADQPSRREADAEAWAGLRATRIAHGVVITLIMTLSGLGLVLGAFAGPSVAAEAGAWLTGRFGNGLVLFANGGLLMLILAELVHYGALIAFLRGVRR